MQILGWWYREREAMTTIIVRGTCFIHLRQVTLAAQPTYYRGPTHSRNYYGFR